MVHECGSMSIGVYTPYTHAVAVIASRLDFIDGNVSAIFYDPDNNHLISIFFFCELLAGTLTLSHLNINMSSTMQC